MEEKTKKKTSILLIIVAIIINFITAIFFCDPRIGTCINPFYEIWSFFAFLAGVLGTAIFPLLISIIGSVVYVKITKSKYGYLYCFAILFLILSLFVLYISYWSIYLAP